MSLSRRCGLLLVVVMLTAAALVAHGVIPKASRIARATAKANKAAERSQALQLDLTLRVADREPIGSGSLLTHPTGLARLELRDAADRTERHLLLGTEHAASRNGHELQGPREFLPPLFFLQVGSPATLEQALADYGLDLGAAALAPCGKSVCYVLGDPARVAPPPPTPEERAWMEAAREAGDPVEPEDEEEPDARGGFFSDTVSDGQFSPSVWVDSKSFEIVRIESRSGVIVEFAPAVDFGGIQFPDSITIHEPERDPVRFDILGVTAVNAAAAGFSRAWLLTPTPKNPEESADSGDRVPAAPQGSAAEEPSSEPRAPMGQPQR